jgi:alpha-tubulin suppressor-like RCC1 family protein
LRFNCVGQLGYRIFADQFSPVRSKILSTRSIISVAAGSDHTVILTNDGSVYACGNGMSGETGQGKPEFDSQIKTVRGLLSKETIIAIAAKDSLSVGNFNAIHI